MAKVKLPPFSEEAENAILGAIISQPSLIEEVSGYLSEEIFYLERNKRLYSILCSMSQNGEEIDIITIAGRLNDEDKSSGVTSYYVSDLVNNSGTPSMSKRYAVQVYEKHLLREVITKTHEINDIAYTNNQDVYIILDDAHSVIGKLINIRP